MLKIRTIRLQMDDDTYKGVLKLKKKLKATNWYDFSVKLTELEDKW